jgi:hypothetical protein
MVRDAPGGAPHHEAREFASLFDIVKWDCGQRFASRAAISHARVPGERSETPITGLPEIGTHSLRKSAKADLR